MAGEENQIADLSRIEEVQSPMNFASLVASQEKLNACASQKSGLQLEKTEIPGTGVAVYYDMAWRLTPRPFLIKPSRRAAFDLLHNVVYLGIRATAKLTAQRYIWPFMKKDCRSWMRAYGPCQRAKIIRCVTALRGEFATSSRRFEHIHVNIIVMPVLDRKQYCLACINHFS